jgi:histidinol-phosphatase (PHP family)
MILKHGGRFALSDDSHSPGAVGLNYCRMAEYLKQANISELWYLQSSDMPNAAGRHIKAVKYDGNLLDSAFWKRR